MEISKKYAYGRPPGLGSSWVLGIICALEIVAVVVSVSPDVSTPYKPGVDLQASVTQEVPIF